MVLDIHCQLLTVFAPYGVSVFLVMYALMTQKTCALYREVFAALHDPGVCPSPRRGRLWEASCRCFSGSTGIWQYHSLRGPVAGFTTPCRLCWSAWKSLASKKITRTVTTSSTLFAAFCVSLLSAADIPTGLQKIRATICNDMKMTRQLQQLVTYVQRQWIDTGNATASTDSSDTYDRCEVCLL